MNEINRTLYIPLYGKALVSRRGIILHDPKAEAIWAEAGFPLKGRSASKWLAYYMGMRAAVFDRWLIRGLEEWPDGVVLHAGCGLDSRVERVGKGQAWYDIDFPDVIRERRRFYREDEGCHMIPADLRDPGHLASIPKGGKALVVLEGVSMYLPPEELRKVLRAWTGHFSQVRVLMDHYSVFAARASRLRNPINDVGVTQVYGIDDPAEVVSGTGLGFVKEHEMTPEELIQGLRGMEQAVFRKLYAGKMARKLYRLCEYRSE